MNKNEQVLQATEVVEKMEMLDKYFQIVKVSELSLNDEFMKHEPASDLQVVTKSRLVAAINSGLTDFRRPIMDPSLDNDGNIIFNVGDRPTIGHSPEWWDEKSKQVMPSKNSRLGTQKEYIAFLGTLIKYLVEEQGYKVYEAWRAVCDDSCSLGHYWNSEGSIHYFEPTGSRKVGLWCDLANCSKVVGKENGGFVVVGGSYQELSYSCSLACQSNLYYSFHYFFYTVGWIVMNV